jgi:hypothetical protein
LLRPAAALLAVAACSTAKPPVAPTPGEGRHDAAAIDGAWRDATRAATARMIELEAFDCERDESFPGEPVQSGLVAAGTGIRAWKGGGPGPFEANAGVSDYADITAEDLFVTGFAYGE